MDKFTSASLPNIYICKTEDEISLLKNEVKSVGDSFYAYVFANRLTDQFNSGEFANMLALVLKDVSQISEGAFKNCTSLERIALPLSLNIKQGSNMFKSLKNIKYFDLEIEKDRYVTVGTKKFLKMLSVMSLEDIRQAMRLNVKSVATQVKKTDGSVLDLYYGKVKHLCEKFKAEGIDFLRAISLASQMSGTGGEIFTCYDLVAHSQVMASESEKWHSYVGNNISADRKIPNNDIAGVQNSVVAPKLITDHTLGFVTPSLVDVSNIQSFKGKPLSHELENLAKQLILHVKEEVKLSAQDVQFSVFAKKNPITKKYSYDEFLIDVVSALSAYVISAGVFKSDIASDREFDKLLKLNACNWMSTLSRKQNIELSSLIFKLTVKTVDSYLSKNGVVQGLVVQKLAELGIFPLIEAKNPACMLFNKKYYYTEDLYCPTFSLEGYKKVKILSVKSEEKKEKFKPEEPKEKKEELKPEKSAEKKIEINPEKPKEKTKIKASVIAKISQDIEPGKYNVMFSVVNELGEVCAELDYPSDIYLAMETKCEQNGESYNGKVPDYLKITGVNGKASKKSYVKVLDVDDEGKVIVETDDFGLLKLYAESVVNPTKEK